ncbi:MAG: putative drug exporter of the superfamily [Solirubrobacteraceae bacterium]|nr:putative drug exporter of the superfamily [Solirubrobacteraceae bacterium]
MARPRSRRHSRAMHSNSFAARAGRWSAQHRKKAIFGWLAFVVVAFVVGGAIGVKKPANQNDYIGQSGRADRLINDHFPKRGDESVLVQAPQGASATSPQVRKAVADVIAAVSRQRGVSEVKSPYVAADAGQVSKDGRSVLVEFKVAGDQTQAAKLIDPIVAAVDKAKADNPSVFVGQFGGASASKALSKSFSDDFKKAETLSLPITLIILVLAFGALVAAGIPLLLGLTAVMATLGLVAIPSQIVPMDDTVSSIVLLVGLAVGVDYTLFYLRREREEKARGASKLEAVHIAAATSGRAVLVSGFTVMVAMAGMFFAGGRTFTALGIGSIMVVAVAMIGSVTVVPAVLAALGDRVEKGRVPFLHRRMRASGESRAWTWVLGKVLRRPALSAIAAAAVLVALALPALGMHTVLTGTDDLPRKLEVMKVYDRMQAAFPGGQVPAVVAIEAKDVTTPQVVAATKQLGDRALATGTMNGPLAVSVSPDRHVASISIPMKGDGTDAESGRALAALRGGIVQDTVGSAPGVQHAFVTGMAAGTKDFNDLMKAHAPLVFAFVLSLAFLLLLVTFRSIVIPIKAIVLNLLSVGAAYGVLTWVFQEGHFQSLLGYRSNGGVVSWLPLFLFVILFGLSMDYHVFILSRIREAFDRGMSTDDAVAYGIKATASTVTSAAVVMVGVFAIFATLSSLDFKQMGVGLSVAILIDATIVRGVLLPATMKLLGKWNWYLPRGLHWLPRISREPHAEPANA